MGKSISMQFSRWLSFAIAALLVASIAFLDTAPTRAAERKFGLTSFREIIVRGDYHVIVTKATPLGATAVGDSKDLRQLEVVVENKRLMIRSKPQVSDRRGSSARAGKVTIYVNSLRLSGVAVLGAGRLEVDTIGGLDSYATLRGTGALSIAAVDADKMTLRLTGSGQVTLAGKVLKLNATTSGSGVLQAGDLAVSDLQLFAFGAGEHHLRADKTASISAQGAAQIQVQGKAPCHIDHSGSATILCDNILKKKR